MAKKQTAKTSKIKQSQPSGYFKGMVSDVDPRLQPKGTYRYARNVKLINKDGVSLTVENEDGNEIVVDLTNKFRDEKNTLWAYQVDQSISNKYVGDAGFGYYGESRDGTSNSTLDFAGNIVGHYSFKNQLFLIICGIFSDSNDATDFRTQFLLIDFDPNGDVNNVTDLQVCYGSSNEVPNLSMDPQVSCRVEGIIENDCVTRVYWTDNLNPLRTFSLKADLPNLDINELSVKPQAQFNQPVLDAQISGGLLTGCYAYFFRYATDEGSISGASPLSNIYYVSENQGSYVGTYGSASGLISGTGFSIKIDDVDTRYDSVEVFAVYWQDLEVSPTVHNVASIAITNNAFGADVTCFHSVTGPPIPNGLAELLIPSNTWDLCKDIAIKDNILFAANLRSIQNVVSEKEWNVKVRRDSLLRMSQSLGDGSLTTNDTAIKDYYCPSPYNPDDVVALFSAGDYTKHRLSNDYKSHRGAHRYLPRVQGKPVLGAASYRFGNTELTGNSLGGCRITFNLAKKNSDTQGPKSRTTNLSYGSSAGGYGSFYTESYTQVNSDNTSAHYKAVLSNVGGAKDAGIAGNNRGYQRGETYRFGVLVYDKAGNPGNVLWIGDIQMPTHHDAYWQRDIGAYNWDTYSRDDLFKVDDYARDFRISMCAAQPVPCIENKYNLWDRNLNEAQTNGGGSNDKRYFWSTPGKNSHWTYDLNLIFEFKIPLHVREKISGFQVVRAQRREQDRTVLQQGVLKQLVYYGKNIFKDGYATGTAPSSINNPAYSMIRIPYSVASNESTALGGPFATPGTQVAINDGSNPFWPEYDLFVGGHLGLNYYSNALDPTDANQGDGTNYVNNDDSDALQILIMKDQDGYINSSGTDYLTNSRHFGQEQYGHWYNGNNDNSVFQTRHFSLNAWVMYSPDSAFGVRPYQFTNRDHLQIVSIMKLRDRVRTEISTELDGNTTYGPAKGSVRIGGMENVYSSPQANINEADEVWQYAGWWGNNDKGDYYCSRKNLDNSERAEAVVGFWAVYDTYYHHYVGDYMFSDGSNSYFNTRKLYVNRSDNKTHSGHDLNNYGVLGGNAPADQTNPYSTPFTQTAGFYYDTVADYHGNYFRLGNAKQLYDGEIVDPSFFETWENYSSGHPSGWNSGGFTNHSLTFGHLGGGAASFGTGAQGGFLDGQNFTVGSNTDHCKRSSTRYSNGVIAGSAMRFMGEANRYSMTYSQIQRGTRGILLNIARTTVLPLLDADYSNRPSYKSYFSGSPDLARVINDQNYHSSNGSKGEKQKQSKKIPYTVLANIVRPNESQYGGNSLSAIENTRYISAGNFHPINSNEYGHTSIVFGGDTFVTLYSHQTQTSPYPRYSRATWEVFPVESYVNTTLRSGYHLANNDNEVGFDQNSAYVSNDWLYNPVYSQEKSLQRFVSIREEDCDTLDLPYQISYSQTKLRGEPYDAFRTFPYLNFHDVEGAYGEITGLINHNNEIYFTQEKAFGKLLINPRTFINDDTTGTQLFTGQGQTLETEQYISNVYGSRHTRSLVASNLALYFFDINNEKILQYIDKKGLRVLSDEKGIKSKLSSYLNKGRLKVYDKYARDPNARINANDMPLNFIGIHGAFEYKTRRLFYTILDGLRIDNIDRNKYPTGPGVYTDDEGIECLGINPWKPDNRGGYAERWRINNTVIFNEELDAFTSFSDVTPPHWINHQGYLYSTKNRFNFRSWNIDLPSYPTNINGTSLYFKGHEDYAEVYFNGGRHRSGSIKEGSLQLWKYGASPFKNWYYREFTYGTSTGASNTYNSNELQYDSGLDSRELAYTLYTGGAMTLENYLLTGVSKHVYTSIFETAINDFSTVNKKYDNLNIYVTSNDNQPAQFADLNYDRNMIDRNGQVAINYNLHPSLFGSNVGPADQRIIKDVFYKSVFITDNNNVGMYRFDAITTHHKYREGVLRFPLRSNVPDFIDDDDNVLFAWEKSRMTGTYLTTKLYSKLEEKFNIFAVSSKFRRSFN